jgi:hypothetical protein
MSRTTFSAQQLVDDSVMLRVGHITVIARICHRLGLTDMINESIPCNTDIDLGTLITGMVCDTLSGPPASSISTPAIAVSTPPASTSGVTTTAGKLTE